MASTCLSQVIVVGGLDHETESNHYITVRVTDSKGLFRVHRFQISIVDVNERPTVRRESIMLIMQISPSY